MKTTDDELHEKIYPEVNQTVLYETISEFSKTVRMVDPKNSNEAAKSIESVRLRSFDRYEHLRVNISLTQFVRWQNKSFTLLQTELQTIK